MVSQRFQDLKVYRLAEDLSEEIWKIVRQWQPLEKDTVGKQIIRSADSIGANIAEGLGRGSFQDNKRFVKIARGSLYETQHWLRRAYYRQLLTQEQLNRLKQLVDELAPKLNAYLNSIGKSNN
ncbi:four helix bundle protein [Euhalothece natronophila Z-M001]|uniref:Four helix bundle protein n=1 Tax=Euhalothece natronophila Z-M001 TaxID=522448 RepID=A0A5B8NPT9_9CHRO|nr:four helix bundle protein [Euhalothece natronophila]QDZ41017.1 four helix bundle protein [Euhalothece natronophila Z-M001]